MKTIEELIADSMAAIRALFDAGIVCVISWSGGKDSSVTAMLVLNTAKEAVAAGLKPMVIVTTGDTLIDNPDVVALYRAEQQKMREFGRKHGFEVITKVVTPNLASTWQVNVLSGRSLPAFAGTPTACSVDMKIRPQQVFRRSLFKTLGKGLQAVTCLGSRFDESVERAANMEKMKASATIPTRNKDGDLVLCPIAHWTTDDVWMAVGYAANGLIDSYSEFQDMKRIYSASENSSCAVVADALSSGRKSGGCGARTGCVTCLQSEDKSLENMVLNDASRYGYAKGLVQLNKFLRKTRYDWSRRHWLGRVVKSGYLCLQPGTYHPSMLRDLTRFMLQIDYDELNRAEAKGVEPMFQLLSPEMLVAIDAMWSLNVCAKPFTVWADYRAIRNGVRYDIPEIEEVVETPLPAARFLYVGESEDSFSGMRDAYTESLTEISACGMELQETKDGRFIWDLETNTKFSVDPESAYLLMHFEMDSMIAKHNAATVAGGATAAFKWYLGYGVITLTGGQNIEHDEILRRSELKDSLGLSYDYNVRDLLARSVDFGGLPDDARAEWESQGVNSQGDMFVESIYDEIAPKTAPVQGEEGWIQPDMFAKPKPVIDPALIVRIPGISYVPHIEKGWSQPDIFERQAA